MIKINKSSEPTILVDNKAEWKKLLLDKIAGKGGFSKLSSSEKNQYVDKYNHPKVQEALKDTNGVAVCAYCEQTISTGYLTVEHFYPKALYPDLTFEWDNMIAACIVCNGPKGNYDTKNLPFINPLTEDPEEYLTYEMFRIKPRHTKDCIERQKALMTIEKCGLERIEIIEDLSDKYKNFYCLEQKLKEFLSHYKSLNQNAAKQRYAQRLLETFNCLKNLTEKGKSNAGYTRHLIRQSTIIEECMDVLTFHSEFLKIPATGYNWGWKYNIPYEY